MGRPATSKVRLKDGYYIEVRSKSGSDGAIKIWRRSKQEIDLLIKHYSTHKDVTYLGKMHNGKFVKDKE